jgi:hypothetical protein
MEHMSRPAVIWGAVWGAIQAASPLAFWWLDASTVYAEGDCKGVPSTLLAPDSSL